MTRKAENLQPRFSSSAVPTTAYTAEQREKKKYWTELAVQCSQECMRRQNNLSTNEWRNTGGPTRQAETLLSTYIWRRKKYSFEDNNVNILAGEDRWFERGVKESIYIKLERPSLNREGGLRHYLSPTNNTVLSSLSRQLNNHPHLGSARLWKPTWKPVWPTTLNPSVNHQSGFLVMATTEGVKWPEHGCHVSIFAIGQVMSWLGFFLGKCIMVLHYVVNIVNVSSLRCHCMY